MAKNWSAVFTLASIDTDDAWVILLRAVYSLKADTQNSLNKIIIDIKPIKISCEIRTSESNAAQSNILSAIGSNNFPSDDSRLYFLAKYPSKKSVNAAKENKISDMKYISNKTDNMNIIGPQITLK